LRALRYVIREDGLEQANNSGWCEEALKGRDRNGCFAVSFVSHADDRELVAICGTGEVVAKARGAINMLAAELDGHIYVVEADRAGLLVVSRIFKYDTGARSLFEEASNSVLRFFAA